MKVKDITEQRQINIDYRPAQRAAMDKINPANYSNERDYAQAAAAAGNTAGSTAMQGLDLNNPTSYAQHTRPAPIPTAAQQSNWSQDATDDQAADWRNGRPPVATAFPVAAPANTTPTQSGQPRPAAASQWNPGVLGMGSNGSEVEALQRKLGIEADGKYGPATKKAVEELQKKLGVSVDGAYGPVTKKAHEASTAPHPTLGNTAPQPGDVPESLDRILTFAGIR
jgi:murein L,D-transpeptidase YcbB/YkuD